MELKIADIRAKQFHELLGISVDRCNELAERNAINSAIYEEMLSYRKDPNEYGKIENELLRNYIKECETVEEVVLVSLTFLQILNDIRRDGLQ